MRVAIVGGTGFIGSYIVDALLDAGHDVSVLVRPGSESKLERAGEVRAVEGDIDSAGALAELVAGCDAVIYCVGILREFPGRDITFERLQYDGVVRTIAAAQDAGASRFLLMSANGVRVPGTPYQETKKRAEDAALSSGLDVTLIRPSVVFGDPHGKMEFATQLFRDMIRLPLPAVAFHTGGHPVQLSPVHVRDVALVFEACLANGGSAGQVYELGGPESLSMTEILRRIAQAVGRSKLILPMPVQLMKLAALPFDRFSWFPVTRDQLTMLAEGNTADPATLRELLGRPPMDFSIENLAYLHGSR